MSKFLKASGKLVTVDDADYERLSQFRWEMHNGYVCRRTSRDSGQKHIRMHREIMGLPEREGEVDHADGDPLNNQRSNLRICTRSQNARNRQPNKGTVSGYKGVALQTRGKKWVSKIQADGRISYLGLFDDARDAAEAYDRAAVELHGEFARTN